jgi:putative NADPH-quinone reductase
MHVLLVYPTWWFCLPAPGVALRLRRTGGIEPLLTKIQRIGVVTTYGSPRWLLWIVGWPDRRMVNSAFRSLCARNCPLDWIALTRMDTCSAQRRRRFLALVRRRLFRRQ